MEIIQAHLIPETHRIQEVSCLFNISLISNFIFGYLTSKNVYKLYIFIYVLGSSFVRNELMHTDIRTGKSRSLRAHRTEEPPIDMIRVSHLKQVSIFKI